jgi:hypothetical protein
MSTTNCEYQCKYLSDVKSCDEIIYQSSCVEVPLNHELCAWVVINSTYRDVTTAEEKCVTKNKAPICSSYVRREDCIKTINNELCTWIKADGEDNNNISGNNYNNDSCVNRRIIGNDGLISTGKCILKNSGKICTDYLGEDGCIETVLGDRCAWIASVDGKFCVQAYNATSCEMYANEYSCTTTTEKKQCKWIVDGGATNDEKECIELVETHSTIGDFDNLFVVVIIILSLIFFASMLGVIAYVVTKRKKKRKKKEIFVPEPEFNISLLNGASINDGLQVLVDGGFLFYFFFYFILFI